MEIICILSSLYWAQQGALQSGIIGGLWVGPEQGAPKWFELLNIIPAQLLTIWCQHHLAFFLLKVPHATLRPSFVNIALNLIAARQHANRLDDFHYVKSSCCKVSSIKFRSSSSETDRNILEFSGFCANNMLRVASHSGQNDQFLTHKKVLAPK